jgi:hypothetical protein
MTPRQPTSHWKRKIIFWIFFLSFIPATILLVGYASGLRIDQQTHQVIETSSLALTTTPDGATVALDGVVQKKSTPIITSIAPGSYHLTLTKEHYRSWQRSVTVTPGRAAVWHHIILFANSLPIPATTTTELLPREQPVKLQEEAKQYYRALGWSGVDELLLLSGPKSLLINPVTKYMTIVSSPTDSDSRLTITGKLVTAQWNQSQLLIATDHEIWKYDTRDDQLQLLWRQTLPILDLTWQPDGFYFFVSDLTGITDMELPLNDADTVQTWKLTNDTPATDLVVAVDGSRLYFTANEKDWQLDLQ